MICKLKKRYKDNVDCKLEYEKILKNCNSDSHFRSNIFYGIQSNHKNPSQKGSC